MEDVRFFGFNNPDPSPGSPHYGYEQWITVGPDSAGERDVVIKAFSGGLYGVTRCRGLFNIGARWKQLGSWLERSDHTSGKHQWLEESLNMNKPISTAEFENLAPEQFVTDLYVPIAE